jgi:hypothetical protein
VDKNTLHKKEATEKQQKSIPAVNMRLQLGVARIEEVLAPTTKLLPLFPVWLWFFGEQPLFGQRIQITN